MKPWRRSGGLGAGAVVLNEPTLTYNNLTLVLTWTWTSSNPPFWSTQHFVGGVWTVDNVQGGAARTKNGPTGGNWRVVGVDVDGVTPVTPYSNVAVV